MTEQAERDDRMLGVALAAELNAGHLGRDVRLGSKGVDYDTPWVVLRSVVHHGDGTRVVLGDDPPRTTRRDAMYLIDLMPPASS
ncbi:hypothetical protein B8281_16045 [Cellulosimicrobium sp. TH-20]|uniref:hypothetical protein n=1 Tax=Cellulosimicrobium sp. TH-20 TaxID=1980001 RepID=UPI000A17F0F1|nr:hypothetical protein [Cellulosimicrobium sp. TH-20]ARK06004.1 hypothetical protein B8281_16045 [Cellulosimicrobium sp. TH-20]